LNVAYVDTSCLVALAFGEKGWTALARRLDSFDELVSSNLLEAELRAALAREKAPTDSKLLNIVSWVMPNRALSREITSVLAAGYVRGADLWHLACALYLAESPRELVFLTLDDRQKKVAAGLGFQA